jgi:hypothetical protein
MLLKHVFVLEIEYLSMELVYHLKKLALMVKDGMIDYWYADVQKVNGTMELFVKILENV